MEAIEEFDRSLLLFLNSLQISWLDKPVLVLTSTLFQLAVVALFIFFLSRRYGLKAGLLALGGIGLVVLLADMISVHGFKEVFERYRPTHNLEIGPLVQTVTGWDGKPYLGGKFGFVSSHATNLFGMATFLLLIGRPWKIQAVIILFLWPAIVSYTRIYLGVHYPLDILGGALLGTSIGFFVHYVIVKTGFRLNLQFIDS